MASPTPARETVKKNTQPSASFATRPADVLGAGVRDTTKHYECFATMEEVEADRAHYLQTQKRTPTEKP